eukprot:77696_1
MSPACLWLCHAFFIVDYLVVVSSTIYERCGSQDACTGLSLNDTGYTYVRGYKAAIGPTTSHQGGRLLCQGSHSCQFMASSYSLQGNTDCEGTNACSNSYIRVNQSLDNLWVNCRSPKACESSTIISRNVRCSGYRSCENAQIDGAVYVRAEASFSLYNVTIDTNLTSVAEQTYVRLVGRYAGYGARLICREGHTCRVECKGFDSCVMFYVDCQSCTEILYIVYVSNVPPTENLTEFNNRNMDITSYKLFDEEVFDPDTDVLCTDPTYTYDDYSGSQDTANLDINVTVPGANGPICCRGANTCYNMQRMGYETPTKKGNDIICSGKDSCRGATMINFNDTMYCEGYYGCYESTITDVNTLYCDGHHGCSGANITNVQTVICRGSSSCNGATFISDGSDLTIYFAADASGGDATVYCMGDTCTIHCLGNAACLGTTVYCADCTPSCDNTFTICPVVHLGTEAPTFPSSSPSDNPSATPTRFPSAIPSISPSGVPTAPPSDDPTASPSNNPTIAPSDYPSTTPTRYPSEIPSLLPSQAPVITAHPTTPPSTGYPSVSPTYGPSVSPSDDPTRLPSDHPSMYPTRVPVVTAHPSNDPTTSPSDHPTVSPSNYPSASPITASPTEYPSVSPSDDPSISPSNFPYVSPTEYPSTSPSNNPSQTPSLYPSKSPFVTGQPSKDPSKSPSDNPTLSPNKEPSATPTIYPTKYPTVPPFASYEVSSTGTKMEVIISITFPSCNDNCVITEEKINQIIIAQLEHKYGVEILQTEIIDNTVIVTLIADASVKLKADVIARPFEAEYGEAEVSIEEHEIDDSGDEDEQMNQNHEGLMETLFLWCIIGFSIIAIIILISVLFRYFRKKKSSRKHTSMMELQENGVTPMPGQMAMSPGDTKRPMDMKATTDPGDQNNQIEAKPMEMLTAPGDASSNMTRVCSTKATLADQYTDDGFRISDVGIRNAVEMVALPVNNDNETDHSHSHTDDFMEDMYVNKPAVEEETPGGVTAGGPEGTRGGGSTPQHAFAQQAYAQDLSIKSKECTAKGSTMGSVGNGETANDGGEETDEEEGGINEVKDWLDTKVEMMQYYSCFVDNGLTSLALVKNIKGVSDLKIIGIDEMEHQFVIMHHIKQLKK